MRLPVFAVTLEHRSEDAWARLQTRYPDQHYRLSDTVALVRTGGLANDVAAAVGIKGGGRVVDGVVFKLNRAYAGCTDRRTWERLELGEDE